MMVDAYHDDGGDKDTYHDLALSNSKVIPKP